jgi:cell division protein FtsZ
MTVSEAEKAAALVGGRISQRARILWGCSVENSPDMENTIKVLLIITGVRASSLLGQKGGYGTGESEAIIELVR